MICDHYLGSLPCDNAEPHEGGDLGHGCTHTSLADRYTEEASDD